LGLDSGHRVCINGGVVPKWPKGMVCKTIIRGFESLPRLQKFHTPKHKGRNIASRPCSDRYRRCYAAACAFRFAQPTLIARRCAAPWTAGRHHSTRKIEVTCATDPVCQHHYLHRLRKTCASNWEASGIPVRTVQPMLRHKRLETTQKYLGITNLHSLTEASGN
jgi:integrase